MIFTKPAETTEIHIPIGCKFQKSRNHHFVVCSTSSYLTWYCYYLLYALFHKKSSTIYTSSGPQCRTAIIAILHFYSISGRTPLFQAEHRSLGRERQALPSRYQKSMVSAIKVQPVAVTVGNDKHRGIFWEILCLI